VCRDRRKTKRVLSRVLCLGFAVAVAACAAGPASAQGLFGAIFGALTGQSSSPAPRATAYADPNTDGRTDSRGRAPQSAEGPSGGGGQFVSYCVRLCDGRYFPMQRHANVTPAQLCSAMCPASRTKIFSGSDVSRATAPDGSHYGDLDNAFAYREHLVGNCTCNGKDAFGLAPIDVSTDPTLRTGDIVATGTGLMAYTAAPRARRGAETAANFTPVDTSRLSGDLRERLANTTVAKQN
jgi:Protein of unknown function (DUF2865)